ncbi:LCP family protein [Candidatus Daviesbacteria bacterium]|nr:LCP family protein [Candidatus Daviesbacteria bacterium]
MKRIDFKKKRAKKLLKKFLPVILVVSVLMAVAIYLSTLSSTSSVVNYIFSGTTLKSTNGFVNVLLLGMAGGSHDGATLTDTIIIASYNLKTKKVYLISIPRDLWLPALRVKANAVYQTGSLKKEGISLSKTVMGNVVGLPIHYGLRVDFGGFVRAVDILGGIEVMVESSFDDYNYPIAGKEEDLCGFREEEREFSEEEAKKLNIEPGRKKVLISLEGVIATDSAEEDQGAKYFTCRFEHIGFKEGKTLMDGETALKFVRSRHGTNGEASDFARSKRQQKVLQALRDKLLSLQTLLDAQKLSQLAKTLGSSIDMDISVKDALEFARLLKDLDTSYSFILDDSPKENLPLGRKSLLTHPSASDYGGAYVLISQDDDFSIIQEYVRKILSGEVANESSASARTGN